MDKYTQHSADRNKSRPTIRNNVGAFISCCLLFVSTLHHNQVFTVFMSINTTIWKIINKPDSVEMSVNILYDWTRMY